MPKQTVTMTLRSSCQSLHQNHGEGFFTEYGGYVGNILRNRPFGVYRLYAYIETKS